MSGHAWSWSGGNGGKGNIGGSAGTGGGGGSYPSQGGSAETSDDEVRLLLQYFSDNPGGSYPSVLSAALFKSEADGLIESPNRLTGGPAGFRLTEKGKEVLAIRNKALGGAATRYVYKIKTFPGVGMTPYEAPFLVHLGRPTIRVMDVLCVQ